MGPTAPPQDPQQRTALQALVSVTDSPCETAPWANKHVSNAEPACLPACSATRQWSLGTRGSPCCWSGPTAHWGDLEKSPSPLGQEGCGVREEAASRANWKWRQAWKETIERREKDSSLLSPASLVRSMDLVEVPRQHENLEFVGSCRDVSPGVGLLRESASAVALGTSQAHCPKLSRVSSHK